MIRMVDDNKDITIDIKLKNGKEFLDMDITNNPFGERENQVSCWLDENTVITFPMENVAYVKFNFKDFKDE